MPHPPIHSPVLFRETNCGPFLSTSFYDYVLVHGPQTACVVVGGATASGDKKPLRSTDPVRSRSAQTVTSGHERGNGSIDVPNRVEGLHRPFADRGKW